MIDVVSRKARPRLLCAACYGFVACAVVAGFPARAQEAPAPVRVWEDVMSLPTSAEGLPDPNPPFDLFKPRRLNYPYTLRTNLIDRREPRVWRTLNLENEYLRCVVLPDLGGHLYGCTDKINDVEVFYANRSIKLAQIAYRGAWAAVGVEFNFPVSHNWMTSSPVDHAIGTESDGSASIWVGNIDRVYGMQWRVRLTLRPGRAVLEQHTTLYNRSDMRHRFYWWTNAGVEAWEDSRILYPMTHTASHAHRDVDTWPIDGAGTDLSVVGNHAFGAVSRFSYGSREPFMAVYHPRSDAGVVHYSDPTDLPAKKIFSWGHDARGLRWREALSDDGSAYVEVQAGLFRDQETYGFLEPRETVRFSEYWIPVRGLGGISRANPDGAIHLTRQPAADGSVALDVALNVTEVYENASVEVRDGRLPVAADRLTLDPKETFRRRYPGLRPDGRHTVEIRSQTGYLVVAHTEDEYEVTSADETRVGPRPLLPDPLPPDRSEGDWLALGSREERNGRRIEALTLYREGLGHFPGDLALLKAAGRLAVALKQHDEAVRDLQVVLDAVSNDYEAAYYLGHALLAEGDLAGARLAWESSQRYGTWRPAALFALAGLAGRSGDPAEALAVLLRLTSVSRDALRAGALEVALLRSLGWQEQARDRLAYWRDIDPTSSFLRYEATRLGVQDEALWRHLAGDPERILEIAADYQRFGLHEEAVALLVRDYPAGPDVPSEPGTPQPAAHPLVAYYCGYSRSVLGQDPSEDFAAAGQMPTTYVFPNRPETLEVLQYVVARRPEDATAHFLLGSLYLSGGRRREAMEAWETTRRLAPETPVLHRNIGYTLLHSGAPATRAAEMFTEGLRVDPLNLDLYLGLDEAMRRAGRSAEARAAALQGHPDPQAWPALLVYRLARTLADAGRFDEAEDLFVGRSFPGEEGGIDVRDVYVDVRLARVDSLVDAQACAEARGLVEALGREVPGLSFTRGGLEDLVGSDRVQAIVDRVQGACPP